MTGAEVAGRVVAPAASWYLMTALLYSRPGIEAPRVTHPTPHVLARLLVGNGCSSLHLLLLQHMLLDCCCCCHHHHHHCCCVACSDLGCHIDGFIATQATTVLVSPEGGAAVVSGKEADLIEAARTAFNAALRLIKPGESTAGAARGGGGLFWVGVGVESMGVGQIGPGAGGDGR